MAFSPIFSVISPTSPLIQDIKYIAGAMHRAATQTRLSDFSTQGESGKIVRVASWQGLKQEVLSVARKYTESKQKVVGGPAAIAEELDEFVPDSSSDEGQLLVKVTEAEGEDDFESGDIVHAFNRKRILTVHAQSITAPRSFGFNEHGLRDPGTLLEHYLKNAKEFRFERISETEVRRFHLTTGEEVIIGATPNDAGEHMDVPKYLQRRLKHAQHLIFGEPGAEYWYGGSENLSDAGLQKLWDAIEAVTDHRRGEVTSYPVDTGERSDYRLVPVQDFSDEEARELAANVEMKASLESAANDQARETYSRRKYQIDLDQLRNVPNGERLKAREITRVRQVSALEREEQEQIQDQESDQESLQQIQVPNKSPKETKTSPQRTPVLEHTPPPVVPAAPAPQSTVSRYLLKPLVWLFGSTAQAATVTTSIGTRITENVDITGVSGAGPYTITLSSVTTTTANGDTLTDEAATPNSYLITAGAGTSSLTVTDSFGAATAPVTGSSQATTKRSYATITLWEAALDSTSLYAASDDAVGEVYNDSVFDESVTINGGTTVGLNSVTLTVPSTERHDGTAGTGARIVATVDRTISIQRDDVTVEWIEASGNGSNGMFFLTGNFENIILSRTIWHDISDSGNVAVLHAGAGGGFTDPIAFVNNLVYDAQTASADRAARGITLTVSSSRKRYSYNNTVYRMHSSQTNSEGIGVVAQSGIGVEVKNTISVGNAGGTGGAPLDFSYGASAVASNNLSSDATADDNGGSGHVISATTADQFVSVTDGSEDLHLKSGADAIDAGADLAQTPSGVEFDIDNRDRHTQGDTWDIGADEIVFDTISGTVYSDEGSTALTSVTVRVAVNGTDHATTAETNGSGAYSISDLTLASGNVVTVYLEDETQDAVAATVSDGDSLSGLNLYQDRLIVRHDNSGSLTNANLATAAVSSETDISNIYSESSGTVTAADGKELFVWTGDTYAPGGAVVVDDIDVNGTFTMAANAVTVSGTWDATGGTFTSSGTVTFDSTSTETITNNSNSFSSVTLNGSGGVWNLGDAMDVDGTLTLTAGTLDLNGQGLTNTGGSFVNNATLRLQGGETLTGFTNDTDTGTVDYDGSGTYASGLTAGDAYYALTFSGSGSWTLDAALDVNNNLTISSGTLNVSGSSHGVTVGGGFTNAGTFTAQSGTVTLDGTSGTLDITSGGTSFYNLTLNDGGGTATFELEDALDVDNNLTITGGILDVKSGENNSIAVGNNLTNSDTFTARSGTVTFDATDTGNTINPGSSSFYGVTFNGSGGAWDLTTNALDVDNALTITNGTFDLNGQNLTMTGATFSNDGTLRLQGGETLTSFSNDTNSGTVTFDGSGTYASGLTAGDAYYALTFSGSGSWTLDAALDVNNNLTITSGTLIDGANSIAVGGNWSNAGTYTGTGVVTFDASSGTQTLTSGGTGTGNDFQNITKGGGGATLQFVTNAVDIDGTLTIDASTTVDLNGQNITAGTLVNNGTLRLEGGETVTISTKDTDSGTVTYDGTGSYVTALAYGNTYYNLTVDGAGGVWEPDGAVTTNNNLNITNGTFDIDSQNLTVTGTFSNDATLRLLGTETLSLTHDTNSGTVAYDNTATLTNFPANLDDQYYSVSFTGTGLVQLAANLDANGNLTIGSGAELDLNGFDLTIGGDFTNSGTLTNHSGRTITLDGTTQTFNPANITLAAILAIGGTSGTVSLGSNFSQNALFTIASGRAFSLGNFVLTLLDSITNSGTITEGGSGYIRKDATNFYIADSNFDEDPGISLDNEKVYLSINDEDSNKDGTSADTVASAVTVACPNDEETVSLTETGAATEVFRYTTGLTVATYDGSATTNDGTLECSNNDTITATFTDPQDAADTEQDTATATTDTVPTAPSSLSGSADSSTAITWTWTDNSNNETGFRLYNAANDALIATIATANTTSYQETGLTASTTYQRYVKAYNVAGNSTASNTASKTTDSGSSVPTAPSTFAGEALSSTSIRWTWTDNASDETGFKLFNGANDALIATIATANSTAYTETGLTAGTTYRRYLKSYNAGGDSSATSTIAVTTKSTAPKAFSLIAPAAGAAISDITPTFSFEKAEDSDDGIDFLTLTVDSTSYTIHGSGDEAGGASYETSNFVAQYFNENDGNPANDLVYVTIKNALTAGSHTWKVVATDNGGNTRESGTRSFTLDTTNPGFATLSNITTGSQNPTLTYEVADNHSLAELVATFQRATTVLGVPVAYTTLEATTFTLSGTSATVQYTPGTILQFERTYRVRLSLTDAAGNTVEQSQLIRVVSEAEATRQQAQEDVQNLDADTTPVDEIIQRVRQLLPDSPFAVDELEQFATLRRQRQAAEFAQFFDRFGSQIARLALLLRQNGQGWLLVVLEGAGAASDRLEHGLLALNFYLRGQARLLAGRIQDGWHSLARASTGTLAQIVGLYQGTRTQLATLFGGSGSSTVPFGFEFGADRQAARQRQQSDRIVMALTQQRQQVAGWLGQGKDTRVREGLRNRQRLNNAAIAFWTPVKSVGTKTAYIARYNYEILFDREPTHITNVRVTSLTPESAVVEWETNHLTRLGKLNYGTAVNQPYTGEVILTDGLSTHHRAQIGPLEPGTTYYFEVSNQNGDYVFDAYYSLTTPLEGEITGALAPQDAIIATEDGADVYSSPDPESELVTHAIVGDRFRALTIQGGWVSVLLPSGQEGWIQATDVTLDDQAGPSGQTR